MIRLGAFAAISFVSIWTVMMVVSLGLGTTELGDSAAMKATVHAWAARLMWGGVAIAGLHLAGDLFLGLLTKLGLDCRGS